MMPTKPSFLHWLFQPIDIAALVFFRVAFGILGFADIVGSFAYYHLWMDAFNPANFHFHYYSFSWVFTFPEPFMSLFFVSLMVLALAVALGWKYRITAPLFAAGFTWYFLMEKAHYLNHGYLFCWIAWVMVFLPAWRNLSLDIWRKPAEHSETTPRWTIVILVFLMAVVYFFGGIAKLNPDWIGQAMPLKLWLASKANLWLIGPLVSQEWVAWAMSWGGVAFDLSIVFLMLFKRTRVFGFCLVLFFHFTNLLIFNIGIFPYLSIVLTALFFAPNWPRVWVNWLAEKWPSKIGVWQLTWQKHLTKTAPFATGFWQTDWGLKPFITSFLIFIALLHCGLPLRHHYFPGDVAWSEEGHRYAWRMMLRSKQGTGYFIVKDLMNEEEIRIFPQKELPRKQARKLLTHPDMILEYAHHLRDEAAKEGQKVAVYASIRVKLNGGSYHTYVDKSIDLAQEEWSFIKPTDWLLWPD